MFRRKKNAGKIFFYDISLLKKPFDAKLAPLPPSPLPAVAVAVPPPPTLPSRPSRYVSVSVSVRPPPIRFFVFLFVPWGSVFVSFVSCFRFVSFFSVLFLFRFFPSGPLAFPRLHPWDLCSFPAQEQHRMRGIMALNEFPQDNYINPFARQLSEDDRAAFNL